MAPLGPGVGILTEIWKLRGSALVQVIENTALERSGRFVRNIPVDFHIFKGPSALAA
jgi:hypothetical protein